MRDDGGHSSPDLHPCLEEIDLGRVLAALADPWRRRVVQTLAADPEGAARTCASFCLPMAKATRTHHFRVLREAGLIHQDDRGNARLTRLRRDEIEHRFPGLIALLAAEAPREGSTLPAAETEPQMGESVSPGESTPASSR